MWHDFLQAFFVRYEYPKAGAEYLLNLVAQLNEESSLRQLLAQKLDDYISGRIQTLDDVKALLEEIRIAAEGAKIPHESASLLFFLLCMQPLKAQYDRMGLSEDYYAGVARDLRSKLNECYAVKGIWGSFVSPWFAGFFALTRFVIGRLQYEIIQMPDCISADGKYCFHGQTAVNMHIPSGCPLDMEQVHASMAEAAQFFAHHFPDGKVLFHCNSWLLFPGHYEMLPPSSRIRQFMEEFTIIRVNIYQSKPDLWRIFKTFDTEDPAKLPQETSLQRAYARWLQDGKPVGAGLGIRYYPLP